MNGLGTVAEPVFHARSGHAGYDAFRFSGQPLGQALPAVPGSDIQIVRHFGVNGPATVSSRYSNQDHALLTVNLRTSGMLSGTLAGERIARPLRRNQTGFVPAAVEISLEYPSDHSALAMFVPQRTIRGLLDELGRSAMKPRYCEEQQPIAQLVRVIEAEVTTPGFASALMIEGLTRAIITRLCNVDSAQITRDADRIHLPPSKLKRIIDFVDSHVDQPISLTDLASQAGLSQFHFARVFKQANGETPCQFVRSRRLERARLLLATTPMPLAELSLACGFANQSHFTAAFTRAMGVSPARYRRLISN